MSLSRYSEQWLELHSRTEKRTQIENYFDILKKSRYRELKYYVKSTRGVGKMANIESKYWSKPILKYINETVGRRHTYVFNVGLVSVKIAFVVYDGTPKSKLDVCVRWVNKIIHLLSPMTETKKHFDIQVFMTDFKKKLPGRSKEKITANHCNSALISLPSNYISVYRKEEWLKVLIHELLHGFGVDREINLTMLQSVNAYIGEGYVEFWARYLNCVMAAFMLSKKNEDHYNKLFSLFLNAEIHYSIAQAKKILDHMKMNYIDFFQPNHYEESTNVFSYYFISLYLLINPDVFVKMCKKHNVHIYQVTNNKFIIEYILDLFKNSHLIYLLEDRKSTLPKDRSLRMTSIEVVYSLEL